ncbi:hypothetical protein BAE44_0018628 [Dichanthelium oligosanthes]|uniref:TFIIS central domain-containing protein n=1 Tax=Dichanthelium oligosanthes TaxID=888268 RepID=A0A1E5V5B3_9POAL|nr:hypothetical protein BAE44_0018628 [Dichanthelium oligosanthes]
MFGPGNWGAKVPASSYLIVPMGGQPPQVGASSPNAPHLPGARPVTVSRVSLRPPQQVLSVQPALPGILQPSPPAMGKEMASSPNVQMPKPVPSLVSATTKRSVQKEPLLKAYPELSETVRSKFRESLAAALCVDSDQQSVQQSASKVSPIGSSALLFQMFCKVMGPSALLTLLLEVLNVPSFKRTKTSDGATGEKNDIIQKGQSLALRIEEELFKLFGEVNKKYKEKGLSLLFNLKDKSNPVLRERVLSGEITPKDLCSMTTDELASNELSVWRLAKAEELAKMVVRPNREVNVTRLITLGKMDLLGLATVISMSNLECLANGKTDLTQERVMHDLKYTENLPEIMSLDEFVEAPDSDVPLECHSTETAQDNPSFTDKAYLTLNSEKSHIGEGNADLSEFEFTCDTPLPEDNYTGTASISGSTMQLISDATLTNDSVWEGTIQLSLSSFRNVVAIFKSGEKPSTNEWHRLVEIKGRVKLTDFQEFLEQLPKGRSRAVPVTELRRKEGSRASGRQQFLQTIDSYVADERVGLLKLAKGVELYICPYEGKAAQILTEHLPKEHSGTYQTSCLSFRLLEQAPPHHENDATGDVARGFGHGIVKDDDDLPGYDFVGVSDGSPNIATPHCYQRHQHLQAVSPPVDLVSQLVHKYSSMYASAQPWDGHDGLPDWDPSQGGNWYNRMPMFTVCPRSTPCAHARASSLASPAHVAPC